MAKVFIGVGHGGSDPGAVANGFKEKDCNVTSVALDEGTFAYLTPADAHKPCVKSTYAKIKKAVFKIPV